MLQIGNKIRDVLEDKGGFSLLETTLYVAILSTLVFGIAAFLNLISVTQVKNQITAEVDQQAIHIMETITEAIRNAESVTSPMEGGEGNSLILNSAGFSLSGNKIIIDRGGGLADLNNNRVFASGLVFRNLSRPGTPDIIQINFTLTSNNNWGGQVYDYSKNYVAAARLLK